MTFWVAGASVVGGLIGSSGARSAASQQSDAAAQATQLQRDQWQQQQTNQKPWLEAGTNALAKMQGPAGDVTPWKSFSSSDFAADPGYGFRMSEGLKALDRTAAARGGLLSGATLKGAQRYGQDLASQEYGAAYNRFNQDQTNTLGQQNLGYNRLAGLAGIGQNANTQLGQAGQNYANQAGQNIMSGAQSSAAGAMGNANSMVNAINTGMSTYQNQQNFNTWMGAQGGGFYSGTPTNMTGFQAPATNPWSTTPTNALGSGTYGV